jgi:TPR repeat protein
MVQGTFAGAAGAGVTIRVNDNPVAVAFQDLDAYDRLTVDRDFRSAWIDAQASALSWRLLQPAGLGQTNETAALDAAVLDRALALGVPQAQYQVGQQFYKQRDYGYALLYLLAAAPGHAGAQFLLGGMRFQGLGAAADKKAGLTWLALAAAQGQARAEQFLQQQKLSAEVRQKLLQQEQSRQEQELKTLAGRAAAPNRAGTRAAVMPDLTLTAPLKPDDPVVFNDPLTGRSYSYRQGRKTYRD